MHAGEEMGRDAAKSGEQKTHEAPHPLTQDDELLVCSEWWNATSLETRARRRRRVAEFVLVLTNAVFGASFVSRKRTLEDASPILSLGIMFALALLPVAPLYCRGLRCEDAGKGMWCGFVLFAAFALQQLGLDSTTPQRSAFITAIEFTPLIGWVVTKVPPTLPELFAFAIQFAGVVLITTQGLEDATAEDGSSGGGLNHTQSQSLQQQQQQQQQAAASISAALPLVSIGDGLTFLCAIGFAAHIIAIDVYSNSDTFASINLGQFFWTSVFCFVSAPGAKHSTIPTRARCMMVVEYLGFTELHGIVLDDELRFEPSSAFWRASIFGGVLATGVHFPTSSDHPLCAFFRRNNSCKDWDLPYVQLYPDVFEPWSLMIDWLEQLAYTAVSWSLGFISANRLAIIFALEPVFASLTSYVLHRSPHIANILYASDQIKMGVLAILCWPYLHVDFIVRAKVPFWLLSHTTRLHKRS